MKDRERDLKLNLVSYAREEREALAVSATSTIRLFFRGIRAFDFILLLYIEGENKRQNYIMLLGERAYEVLVHNNSGLLHSLYFRLSPKNKNNVYSSSIEPQSPSIRK